MRTGTQLTPRELEVAALVAEGLTNKEIAARLFLSERTAEGHVEHIRDKLGFSTRAQIATWHTQARGASGVATSAAPTETSVHATSVVLPAARLLPSRQLARYGALLAVLIVVIAAVLVLTRASGPTLLVVAGLGTDGSSGDGGPALVAQFSELASLFFDADGRLVVADSQSGLESTHGNFIDRTHIRRITGDGTIRTVSGDGALDFMTAANGGSLFLHAHTSVAPGPAGAIYLAYGSVVPLGGQTKVTFGNWVGRIERDGTFHLLAGGEIAGYSGDGGSALSARLSEPRALAVDHDGTIYVVDTGNNVVRTISPSGTITTIAGTGRRGNTGDDGLATAATFFAPLGLALSADGGVFIADTNNDRVRRIDHGGSVRPVLDGLALPSSLAFGPGDVLYVADTGNARVLRITPDGTVTTVAGPKGLVSPTALAIDASGTLFIGDSGLHQILKLATR